MHTPRVLVRLATLALLSLATTTAALAQWQWIDRDGRKVFSDRPPPSDIADSKVLKRPATSRPGPASNAPAVADAAGSVPPTAPGDAAGTGSGRTTATAAPAAAAPKPSGEDKELVERKRQADAAEAAKKKADDDRLAKLKTENCVRARQSKATLDSGIRIAQVNPQGERIIMDDAARAAEQKRVQDTLSADCR